MADRPVVYRPVAAAGVPRRIVVVGASSGGIDALRALVAGLPGDFPAPICIVLHTAPESPGVLDAILTRASMLPAVNAVDRERLKPGHIYVAPPDRHLIVEPGILRVTRGPRENRFRPAIDPLFRSAAQVFGPAAIGIILTGALDDGTAGLWAIKQLGGIAIAQDPSDADSPSMPQSAIAHVAVDFVLPLLQIARTLVKLTATEVFPAATAFDVEVKIAKEHNPTDSGLEDIGSRSAFTSPERGGVLLELHDAERSR